MANYQNIVDVCRDSIPRDIRFIHGRLIDFTQGYTGTYPLVTLLPFTINDSRSTPDGVFDNANLVVGFWKEDRPDTTAEEREALIAEMDILSDLFISNILESNSTKLTNIQKEPQYQMFQATLSGYAIAFNISLVSPC
jgi:hypothetical protein